jgi:hypothetical protein
MIISSTIAVVVVLAATFWAVVFGGRLPRPYRERQCQGRYWKRDFPDATKQEIREFLAFFIQAFSVTAKEVLKLKPSDEVLAIYRATYPIQGMPDALELETLAQGLQARYGLSLKEMWADDLTLGELFAKTADTRHQAT